MQTLKEEYGIETLEEFRKAMKNLPVLDLTPFCGVNKRAEPKKERKKNEQSCQ